ncbi:hypothetical protein TWF694_007186 [Orbilia ellipsospora]|uniref:Uncharacterized protein n=1 Tax=Orbilia ellipsospora TaxID=2528407 RepID=A0AAV9XGZ6_9PEZI
MSKPTTIDEALQSLPSSAVSFTADQSSNRTTAGRRMLITKKKFTTSTSAEHHKPPQLRWVVASEPHILTNYGSNNSILREKRKIKESILIAGRDSGTKQSLKFSCQLPLPFLEQNGPQNEDFRMDLDEETEETGNFVKGGGLTAEDLEMDIESENNEHSGGGLNIADLEDFGSDDILSASKPKPTPTTHVTKRRRIDADQNDTKEYDSIPKDFLDLLKSEIPGGKKYVSPGEFARVWKLSGRELGNDMVLAQNEYFGKSRSSHGSSHKKTSKGKGRVR